MLDLLHAERLLPEWVPRNATDLPELTGEMHNAIVGFVMSTPSMMALINQEDLFKDPEQQNLPGTTAEYPNWRHKMRYRIEELKEQPASDYAAMFRGWVERSGRG
jgi:4-alpha-glucanotransferase